jgi:hypothetical protein
MDFLRKCCGILLLVLFSSSAFAAKDNKEYYLQHNIWLFKGQTSSVNYAVDAIVPVNSKVTVLKESDSEMKLKSGNTEFAVVLVKKHTRIKMSAFKARLLKETAVDLSKFSKLAQEGIHSGQIVPGMTRAEVLVARGYPPDNATISLDVDTWKYWQTKWNTILVHFENDKVSDIKD